MATTSSAMRGANSAMAFVLLLLGTITGIAADCTNPEVQCAMYKPTITPATINKATFLEYCTKFPKFGECTLDAVSDCDTDQLDDAKKQLEKGLEYVKSVCKSLTADGNCNDALDCLLNLVQNQQETCRDVRGIINCLETKSKTKSCTIDESDITFASVLNFTTNLCPPQECVAAYNAVKLEGVPTIAELSNPEEPLKASFTDPGYYCRHMAKLANSYITKGAECGFTVEQVNRLNATYQQMMKDCPTALGSRLVPETMLALLATALALWLSLF